MNTSTDNPAPGHDPVSSLTDSDIVIYESGWCGFCRAAKRLLDSKGWPYQSRLVDGNAALRAEMTTLSGRTSVPQIFFGRHHVGGFDDMAELEQEQELDALYQNMTR